MKRLMMILAVVSLILVIAACSSSNNKTTTGGSSSTGNTGSNSTTKNEQPQKKENVTLSIMINQTWNKPSLQPVLDQYEALNDHVTIDLQVIPDGQFTQLLNTKVVTKEAPDMVFDNYDGLLKTTGEGSVLLDLRNEPWVERLIDPNTVIRGDGNIYGMPTNSSGAAAGIVYNEAIFAEHKLAIPTTLDEFFALCEQLKELGITPLILSGNEAWTVGMWNTGLLPNVVEDDPNVTWDDLNTGKVKFSDVPGFKRIYEILLEFKDKGYFNENFMSTTEAMSKEMFMQGEGAMIWQGDWFISDLTAQDDNIQMGMFAFPLTKKAYLVSGSLQTLSIFKDSSNIEESKKLMQYLSEAEQIQTFNMDWSTYPSMKDVDIELPAWKQKIKSNTVDAGMSPLLSAGVTSAIPVGTLTNLTQELLSGVMSPEEVLSEWDKEFARVAKERKLPGWE